MLSKREVVRMVLEGKRPPYVPWNMDFTVPAQARLREHYGTEDLTEFLQNHFLALGSTEDFFVEIGEGCVRDAFDVVWDRSVDKDIGVVKGCCLPEPTLADYTFPAPDAPVFQDSIAEEIARHEDLFRVYRIDFSLFERAWTLRGMENLLLDFYDYPEFVHELLGTIADHNIARLKLALEHDFDAVYFGDDWGQQQGLIMGPEKWQEFIYPQLKRMYETVHQAGKFVMIHSCGDVDSLFDDLVEIGLNCFNPFQPEVMDVAAIVPKYRGRLAFHGGLSTQQTLPYGTPEAVRDETRQLLELGREGGYIFAPAHAVQGDVPLKNLLAFIEEIQAQPDYATLPSA